VPENSGTNIILKMGFKAEIPVRVTNSV